MSTEIVKEFAFDAAHFLPTAPEGHPYRRLHGHSFVVEVAVAGAPDPVQGWIVDFGVIEARVAALRTQLDHHLLNEIDGLQLPTLERLAEWIYRSLAADLPGLARVTVRRDSAGQSCTYRP
ncbi:MAG TPA: 6-carboxytetrahydropterin synthase QueD [Stellaceae bacterium]|jgi:6-pyruvoyltetrahydropterin/6-carboxytetrahydropterin synthase|nr:6-carboxytetrahydropterin synthase QueD [Stellaceae bacterium]